MLLFLMIEHFCNFPQLREVKKMGPIWQVLFGWLISVVEIFLLLMWLYFYWELKRSLWLVYSAIVLAINIIPAVLIAHGESLFWANPIKTMFTVSSVSAIISVLALGVKIISSLEIDDDCISSGCVSHISASALIMLIIAFIGILRPDNYFVVIETKSYEDYYEIATEDGQSKVLYVSLEDNTTGYYVVMYDSIDEYGETKLNVVQISPQNVDIIYALEDQEKDYLIVNTTEVIKEDKRKNPHEIISEKTYSYKLVIRKDVPIISVIPME